MGKNKTILELTIVSVWVDPNSGAYFDWNFVSANHDITMTMVRLAASSLAWSTASAKQTKTGLWVHKYEKDSQGPSDMIDTIWYNLSFLPLCSYVMIQPLHMLTSHFSLLLSSICVLKEHKESLIIGESQNIRALPKCQGLRIISASNVCSNHLKLENS